MNKLALSFVPISILCALLLPLAAAATEYHVSPDGDDANDGSANSMLKTISAAARLAQPGDTVTVHEGVYRERVTPPRGGESDAKRIVYQAAPGEKVVVKGSEVVKDWEKVQNDTWKAVLPNTFFGDYNPFGDLIYGDWFDGRGRDHHTGAVYLDGHWLIEATKLDEVLAPIGTTPDWLISSGDSYLVNVAWFKPEAGKQIPATAFAAKQGTQNAPCSEGGECVGFIVHGHWLKYEAVDLGEKSEWLDIRAAAASDGGIIEIRLDAPDGELLGTCHVPHTGDWQAWKSFKTPIKPVSGVKTVCFLFKSPRPQFAIDDAGLWFAEVGETETTVWAQFKGVDPNEHLVEVNVRRAVFYPDKPFMNFITVRGFAIQQAATQWAPPTAEQIGAIGTHWSKGWLIEDNDVGYSVCTGITLGKHGDEFDNTSANTAEGYVKTIERALAMRWNKENIGSHIVRNNTIHHCEQAGLVGSMGAAFSTITGNTIHDCHFRRLFTGAEMSGIKIHAAIDTVIANNHIYRCIMGVWLDWMAQGARVSQNLFHDNIGQDLFVEVNHGPFVIDNNIFLSERSVLSLSRGGAYVHNLMAGNIHTNRLDERMTPYHKPHSTELAGMHNNPRGDDRFYNNIFVGTRGLRDYDDSHFPVFMKGNVYLKGAEAPKAEAAPVVIEDADPQLAIEERKDGMYLQFKFDPAWATAQPRDLITTELLGKAKVPDLPYENRDASPLRIDKDYFGKPVNETNPDPGPFVLSGEQKQTLKVWPQQ